MPYRILGPCLQFIQVCAAHFWIVFFEPPFVCYGRFLNKLDIHRPAPPFIPVEQRLVGQAVDDLAERVGQLHRIVNAAIETQASDRTVHMRSVACQKYSSHPEFCGNALMCLIEVAMNEIVRCRFWKCALKTAVNDFIAERVVVSFIDPCWKAGAPTSLSVISRNFE